METSERYSGEIFLFVPDVGGDHPSEGARVHYGSMAPFHHSTRQVRPSAVHLVGLIE